MGLKVNSLDDIVKLGWIGNYGADRDRFDAINDFIAREPNLQVRQEANWLASYYGMGIIIPRDETYKLYDPAADLPKAIGLINGMPDARLTELAKDLQKRMSEVDRARRKPTREQLQALKRLWERARTTHPSYLRLRRNAFFAFDDCLMVPWCGMVVGIEADGYTHS